MRENAVIIGAGQAAAQLAASLRQGAFDKPISIIGDEPYPPYQRPPLSKKFLTDRGSPESLYLRATGFWRDHGIELHSGTAAAKVDVRQRRVLLRDGRDLDYGVLVLATGTRARSLPVPGIGLANLFSLRNIEDVRRLRPALDHARRIAIIGGGYIGLEIASAMRGESREVTLVEAEARLMKRVMGEKGAAFFADVHRVRGVDIRLGVSLVAIEPAATALGVHLAPVGLLTVDLVLIATGARANDELAAAAGLACDDGVLVDERAATAAPDVYAVGDCARFPSRRYGRRIRLECVQNAIDQAKMAGRGYPRQQGALRPRALVLVRSVRSQASDRRHHGRPRRGRGQGGSGSCAFLRRIPSRRSPHRSRRGQRCPRLHDREATHCRADIANRPEAMPARDRASLPECRSRRGAAT